MREGQNFKFKKPNVTDNGQYFCSTVMHNYDTLLGVLILMGRQNISNVIQNEFSQGNK